LHLSGKRKKKKKTEKKTRMKTYQGRKEEESSRLWMSARPGTHFGWL
jgi:hypothetical protein